MKRFSTIILVILVLLLVMIPAASCGSDDNGNGNTDSTTSSANNEDSINSDDNADEIDEDGNEPSKLEPEIIHDSLPDDLDFGGTEINLLVQSDSWKTREFVAEEEIGDVVNDAVYRRNTAVEERLNLKLNVIEGPGWEGWSTMATQIRNSIMASDYYYDLIAGWSARVPSLAIENLFFNLFELPHIDLDKPWWNQSMTKEMTLGGELHFLAGDMTMSLIENVSVLFFNKTIHQNYELPDLYQTVIDGKWTLDYMYDFTKDIYNDVNGDGAADAKDLYGVAFDPLNIADGFMQAANIKMISSDDFGMPVLDVEQEKLGTLIQKVYNLYYENPGARVTPQHNEIDEPFKNDLILFMPKRLMSAIDLRDMQSDYGIIPYPKFDEAQENYLARVWDALSLMCVPMNANKTEEIGAFMEAMASESYHNLTPAYFDIALKGKYTRDDASSQMLDIVRDGAYMNFASIYNESIGSPWHCLRSLMGAKNNNFASWYEKNEGAITRAIEKLVEKVNG